MVHFHLLKKRLAGLMACLSLGALADIESKPVAENNSEKTTVIQPVKHPTAAIQARSERVRVVYDSDGNPLWLADVNGVPTMTFPKKDQKPSRQFVAKDMDELLAKLSDDESVSQPVIQDDLVDLMKGMDELENQAGSDPVPEQVPTIPVSDTNSVVVASIPVESVTTNDVPTVSVAEDAPVVIDEIAPTNQEQVVEAPTPAEPVAILTPFESPIEKSNRELDEPMALKPEPAPKQEPISPERATGMALLSLAALSVLGYALGKINEERKQTGRAPSVFESLPHVPTSVMASDLGNRLTPTLRVPVEQPVKTQAPVVPEQKKPFRLELPTVPVMLTYTPVPQPEQQKKFGFPFKKEQSNKRTKTPKPAKVIQSIEAARAELYHEDTRLISRAELKAATHHLDQNTLSADTVNQLQAAVALTRDEKARRIKGLRKLNDIKARRETLRNLMAYAKATQAAYIVVAVEAERTALTKAHRVAFAQAIGSDISEQRRLLSKKMRIARRRNDKTAIAEITKQRTLLADRERTAKVFVREFNKLRPNRQRQALLKPATVAMVKNHRIARAQAQHMDAKELAAMTLKKTKAQAQETFLHHHRITSATEIIRDLYNARPTPFLSQPAVNHLLTTAVPSESYNAVHNELEYTRGDMQARLQAFEKLEKLRAARRVIKMQLDNAALLGDQQTTDALNDMRRDLIQERRALVQQAMGRDYVELQEKRRLVAKQMRQARRSQDKAALRTASIQRVTLNLQEKEMKKAVRTFRYTHYVQCIKKRPLVPEMIREQHVREA